MPSDAFTPNVIISEFAVSNARTKNIQLLIFFLVVFFTCFHAHAEPDFVGYNSDIVVTLSDHQSKSKVLTFEQNNIINQLPNMDQSINLDPWASHQKLQQLTSVFINLSLENKLWFLLRKAQAENLLYFYDDFKKTVKLAEQRLTKNQPAEITGGIYYYLAIAAQRNNNYKLAIDLFNQSMAIAKQANLSILFVQGKLELAYTLSLTENFETSLIDLQAAYVEAFTLRNEFLLSLINENYGAIYGYMGEYDKSIVYYEKALTSYQQFKYPAHVAEALFGIATTYRYWNKPEQAITYFKRYQKAIVYSPNQDISFFAYYGLGMTLAEKGDCNDALPVIEKALKLKGFVDYNAELYKQKTLCLLSLNKIEQAKIALKKSEAIFSTLPELAGTSWQIEVIKISSELEFLAGNTKKAYQLLKKYYKKNTLLLKKNSSTRLAKVRSTLELEQKNIEIVLLNQQAKVHQLQVEKERQINDQQQYLIITTLILIFLSVLFIVYQRQTNKKVLALSIIDPLSNLYNRRYIFDFLEKRLNMDNSNKGQLSLVLLDIDNFKGINDTYGHPFGDEVIKRVAEIGQLTLRGEDVMGRIGGEEFLCILPRLDAAQSFAIADRLRDNISKQLFNVSVKNTGTLPEKSTIHITVSVGISSLTTMVCDSSTLYLQADTALYQAKESGKNKVVIYTKPNKKTPSHLIKRASASHHTELDNNIATEQ